MVLENKTQTSRGRENGVDPRNCTSTPRQDVNRVVFKSSSERQSFVLFVRNIWPQASQKSCYFVVHINYNVY